MPQRKIKGIMTKDVITASPEDSIKEVVRKLSKNGIGGLPVIDEEKKVLGIVTETDILKALKTKSTKLSLVFPSSHALGMTFQETSDFRELKDAMNEVKNLHVNQIMSKDVITVTPEATIAEVASIMAQNNINRIPVVKNNKLVGIVTRGDIIKGLSK